MENPRKFELENVHQVYDEIAEQFSGTRYKAWPIVENFLMSQLDNSVGVDVGCGNGKNITVNPKVSVLGLDYCQNLVRIASTKGEAAVADNLNLHLRDSIFDFCLSIAVIHHFSTKERRSQAVSELARITKIGGKILIFVWAFEQQGKRSFSDQDAMVSWSDGSKTLNRFYHLFKKGELDELVLENKLVVLESGYDRDNWFVICQK